MYIYKRGLFSTDECKALARFFGGVGCIMAISFIMRGLGRASNPKYVAFIKALTATSADHSAYLSNIRNYDFEFNAWPVTYAVSPKLK